MPARIVTVETKAVLEGQLSRMALAYPWKLIASQLDGHCQIMLEDLDYLIMVIVNIKLMLEVQI